MKTALAGHQTLECAALQRLLAVRLEGFDGNRIVAKAYLVPTQLELLGQMVRLIEALQQHLAKNGTCTSVRDHP